MLHGFKELSKEKPKNGQLCHCLSRSERYKGEDVFIQHIARFQIGSFWSNDSDGDMVKIYDIELWLPCDIDVDGILCDEMYEIEECDLKQYRYMSKRTIPE